MTEYAGWGGAERFAPTSQMRLLCTAAWLAKAVSVAAELGLADLMATAPRSVDELAHTTQTHPDGLARLLRLLASFGVFTTEPDGRYTLTPLSSTLRSDGDDTLREYVITQGRPWYWQACGDMLESVRTGKDTWTRQDSSVFRLLDEQPEEGAQFARAMNAWNGGIHAATAERYDCTHLNTLVDVGGSYGSLLREFLIRYPHLKGILFDLPSIIEGATHSLAAAGLSERVTCVAGDFFESVPSGGDLYMLSFVLHDWTDEDAGRVLRACRNAMHPDARLLIVELVLPSENQIDLSFIMDLKMLVHSGGRERTLEEYRLLLERNGFAISTSMQTTAEASLIEAVLC